MSKKLWTYLRSRVQIVTTKGETLTGVVTDFVDEMDNEGQDDISLFIEVDNPFDTPEIVLYEDDIVSIQKLNDDVIKLGEDVWDNWMKFDRPTKKKY